MFYIVAALLIFSVTAWGLWRLDRAHTQGAEAIARAADASAESYDSKL